MFNYIIYCPRCTNTLNNLLEVDLDEVSFNIYLENGEFEDRGSNTHIRNSELLFYECPECGHHSTNVQDFIREKRD